MMRYLLLLLCLSLSLANYAQEEEGWPIVENCLGELPYPSILQENWDFEGVIFNYNGEGVRAIRTDVETSFFIILEDENNFPAAGSFSPDGRWLAYPTGIVFEHANMIGDSIYHFTGIAVVSSDPHRQRMDYELAESEHSGAMFINLMPYALLAEIAWSDNSNLDYLLANADSYSHLNVETGEMSGGLSTTEAINQRLSPEKDWIDLDNGRHITTLYTPVDDQTIYILGIYDTDGEILEEITRGYIYDVSYSPDKQSLVFLKDNRIHVANLNTKTIEDLCLELPYDVFASNVHYMILWSPDGNYLAFLYDGYPVLLNLQTREMQILRYRTISLMGWYPLPES